MMDPIADMLTRIRNASMNRKAEVLIPLSKVKLALAKILEKEKYVGSVAVSEENGQFIKIKLKYENKKPAITLLKRISTIGRQVYAKKGELPNVLNGYGFAIISTSRGMMTNKEARKLGLGGEIVCEIY